MNLFVLDADPIIAAKYNCDVHCNKIITEILGMAANCFDKQLLEEAPRTAKNEVRKHSHYNHPVSIWMRKTTENFYWSMLHAFALEQERMKIGYKPYKFLHVLDWFINNIEKSVINKGELTEFAVAINENMNCRKLSNFSAMSVIDKYRAYYKLDKPFASWKNREIPHFML